MSSRPAGAKAPWAPRATLWSAAALLIFGVLTLWVRLPWAVAAFQGGFCLCAIFWFVYRLRRPGPIDLPLFLMPLAFAPLWGGLQLLAGWSVYGWETAGQSLTWLVHLTAAFLILQTARHDALRQPVLTALLAFATLLSVQATLQVFTSEGRVFWWFDSGYATEVLGPFVSRNNYAQFIELFLPLAVWRAITDRRRAPLWVVVSAILVASVLGGASRSGFALLVIEVVLVLALAFAQGRLPVRTTALVAAQMLAAMAVWGFVVGWDYLLERLFGQDPLQDLRWPMMSSTLSLIAERPWTGFGLGTWPIVYPQWATFDTGLHANQAHCDWLQWAAEGGLPFLAAMAVFFGLLLKPALRTVWGIGPLIVLLHGLLDFPMQQRPAFATLVIAMAAFAAAESGSLRISLKQFATPGHLKSMVTRTLLAVCLLATGLPAQTPQRPAYGPMADAGAANLPGQKIGANDLLAISVYDAPEFTRTVRVSAEGYIRLPMVSQRLVADGLLPSELETTLGEMLVKEGLFVNPVVMITVVEYASRPISVVGAVRRPITFQAVGRVTVLDAIARAEGLASEAGSEILLTQPRRDRASGAEQRLITRIPVRELIDNANPDLNVLLTGGEELRIPEARKIFVTGNVKRPGAFPVKEGSGMTVLKALALAEGLAPFPQKFAYIYRPDEKDPAGKKEIQVELAKIMKRQAVDFDLEPEDTLYVPLDSGKKNTVAIAEKITGFGIATASGMLIWKR